ncbi:MAG: murein biosynthesis integral membrane protein MurJ [Anaerolineae bacterium]|nr:murein biosynthesis integral membrane protein MurJ [Anaerolineae bacterium]
MTQASTRRHIARNVLVVAASFGLAAAAGLFRNAIIAATFGIGASLDAYYAAFKLPDLLFTIVAGGALATAFIPVFADYASTGNRRSAWRLTAAVTNWVALIVALLAILAALIAPLLVRTVIAPGFSPEQQAETASVMRLVLVSTVVFGISAVLGSALNGFKHFLLPALAPVVYPLAVAAGALLLAPTMGVRGLAIGAVVGSVLHLLIKVPALLMGPRVIDLGVFHFTMIAMTNLASRLGPGSVSSLEWGWDAMQLPETIIGTAFGLVAFPTLAELAAKGERDGLRRTLGESLRTVLALAIPAAAGLILLGRPLLAMLYQRGEFDQAATAAVYATLQMFALGLAAHASLELAARAYFAQKDTVTPLLLAIGSAVLNVALGLLLMRSMGAAGLALANSVAVTLEVLALLWFLRPRLGGVEGRETAGQLLRVLGATLVMAGGVMGALLAGETLGLGGLALLAAAGAAGAVTYLAAAWALRVRELGRFVRAVIG